MNNEIKLMLNIIKDVSEHKEGSRNGLMILSCKDYKTLYDYITNLQQKYEELDNRYKNSCEEYQKLVEELTGENERLKEEKQRLLYNLEKVCEEDATTNN